MTFIPGAAPSPSAIAKRARAAGIELHETAAEALAAHARLVLEANERLHLTTITTTDEFLERHLGESLEGAALLPEAIRGVLLDLGSGNGYPGIPLAIARPGLTPVLAEASAKKAAFLARALEVAGLGRGKVLETAVTRASDVEGLQPIAVLASRAMGGWERIIPKLVSSLASDGVVLLWGGADAAAVITRSSWNRLVLTKASPLPGRERARIFQLTIR